MKFALKNASIPFKRVTDIILSSVKRQFALVNFDDIVMFSQAQREHINRNKHVLGSLYETGITFKLKKCAFSRTRSIISVTLSVRVDLKWLITTMTLYVQCFHVGDMSPNSTKESLREPV